MPKAYHTFPKKSSYSSYFVTREICFSYFHRSNEQWNSRLQSSNYDEDGNTVFTVEGKLAWGHCLHILNAAGEHIGTVQQRVLTFLPKFDLYEFDRCIGTIKKEFTFFVPHFTVEGSDWAVEGQFMEWDYTIVSASRGTVATIGKELFHWTDTYVIDVADPADALHALMVVLAIDAEKCSRSN